MCSYGESLGAVHSNVLALHLPISDKLFVSLESFTARMSSRVRVKCQMVRNMAPVVVIVCSVLGVFVVSSSWLSISFCPGCAYS
jgi:hypothetical protein